MSWLRRVSEPSAVIREDSCGSDIAALAATDDEEDEGMVQCSTFVERLDPTHNPVCVIRAQCFSLPVIGAMYSEMWDPM
jgi:hypothetical protein